MEILYISKWYFCKCTSLLSTSDFIRYLTAADRLSDWRGFCGLWYWRKACKSCWGQMCSAAVSLMSCGRRSGQTGRQAARCLRIILSDMLRTKRADLQISASHWNDPEMTQWTVSSRQTRDLGGWMDVTVEVNADEAVRDPANMGNIWRNKQTNHTNSNILYVDISKIRSNHLL